jgi:exonuclease III
MTSISIATFNVNSVKARLANLLAWLDESRTYIVMLQQLKMPSPQKQLPFNEFAVLGKQRN